MLLEDLKNIMQHSIIENAEETTFDFSQNYVTVV